MLRDYTFISSSQYNRSCFINQITSIFHSNPYYKVITALDYHQCLCLLCSDFPRTLVADAVKILPPNSKYPSSKTDSFISTLSQEPTLFEKFDIEDLRLSMQLLFFYSEFIENIKEIFNDLASGDFDTTQVTVSLIFSAIENLYKKGKLYNFPPQEALYEAIAAKSQKKIKMDLEDVYMIEDMQVMMTGAGTISYREFYIVKII